MQAIQAAQKNKLHMYHIIFDKFRILFVFICYACLAILITSHCHEQSLNTKERDSYERKL